MYNVHVNHIVWGREEYLKPVVASISFDTHSMSMDLGNSRCLWVIQYAALKSVLAKKGGVDEVRFRV